MISKHASAYHIGRSGEDRYCVTLLKKSGIEMAAVFDGHGGSRVSNWLSIHLSGVLDERLYRIDFKNEALVKTVITKLFEEIDHQLWDSHRKELRFEGSTVTMILHRQPATYVVNLGDSRTVIFSPDSGNVILETRDHAPGDLNEKRRILAAGGTVTHQYNSSKNIQRVDGWLALSRAIGDFDGKYDKRHSADFDENSMYSADGSISARPDVYLLRDITSVDSPYKTRSQTKNMTKLYALLGSDGIFETMPTSQQFADSIRSTQTMAENCDKLIQFCKKHTNDDLTVILLELC